MTTTVRAFAPARALPPSTSPAHALIEGLQSAGIPTSPALRAELEQLSQEHSPALFAEAVFALAGRSERENPGPLAPFLYDFLVRSPRWEAGSDPASAALRERALAHLQALAGHGTAGAAAELFLRNFAQQAADPAMLVGMACAGAAFRLTRFFALSELASFPLLSRTGARLLAGTAGFAVEAPTFVLATRGVHAALDDETPGAERPLGDELLSAYLFLGAMKLSGAATESLHRRWIGEPQRLSASGRLSAALLSQVGMLAGIGLAQRLEIAAGLRPAQDASSLLAEGLATLLHFHVGGRLFRRLTGSSFAAWEQAMDLRTESLVRRPFSGFPSLATAKAALGPNLVAMSQSQEEPFRLPIQLESRGSGPRSEISESTEVHPETPPGHVVAPEASIPEVLRYFSPLDTGDAAAGGMRVELPAGFAKRLSDWGYEWQETMQRNHALDSEWLCRLHEGVKRGEAVPAGEKLLLQELIAQAEDSARSFERDRRLLTRIAELSRHGAAPDSPTADRALDRVLHDLSHRPHFLQLLGLAAGDLARGIPLEDFYLEYLQPRRGFALGQTLQEGMGLAATEAPEFVTRLGNSLHFGNMDRWHLVQGGEAARGLGDIVANLLTNAWRYRRGEDAELRFEARPLVDGSLEITVSDDGIGIEAENLLNLGDHGFREARKDLPASHGFGLSSVIANLRELGWGPLWVRSRVGEGTSFRFAIPADRVSIVDPAAVASPLPEIDRFGLGPATNMELNLAAGYSVPVASLDLAMRELMREVPGILFLHEDGDWDIPSRHWALKTGALRLRRLEILHRLLAGPRPVESLRVLENGPGPLIDTAFTLLSLGSPLVIKEPGTIAMSVHPRHLRQMIAPELRSALRYVSFEELDDPVPSDIVYWANPDPYNLKRPRGMGPAEYFVRDVAPGGFLVLQTDHHGAQHNLYRQLNLDPTRWETILNEELSNLPGISNQFLPTGQGVNLHLQIYRRRP